MFYRITKQHKNRYRIKSNSQRKQNKNIISHHILQTGNLPQKSLNHQSINHQQQPPPPPYSIDILLYIENHTHTGNKHDTFHFFAEKNTITVCVTFIISSSSLLLLLLLL